MHWKPKAQGTKANDPTRVKQLRPLRSATITINGATQTFPPAIPDTERKILTDLGFNPEY